MEFDAEGTKESSPDRCSDDSEVEDRNKRKGKDPPPHSVHSEPFSELEENAEASGNTEAFHLLRGNMYYLYKGSAWAPALAGAHASGRAGQHFDNLRCSCPIWHALNFKVMPRV